MNPSWAAAHSSANTPEEIMQAMRDFGSGKLGKSPYTQAQSGRKRKALIQHGIKVLSAYFPQTRTSSRELSTIAM